MIARHQDARHQDALTRVRHTREGDRMIPLVRSHTATATEGGNMSDTNTDATATVTNESATAKGAPKVKRDKHAKVRAAILAAPNMEAIANIVGESGKSVFRVWVRANLRNADYPDGKYGTNTRAMLSAKTTPKGASKPVPNIERVIARFVEGKRDA